MTKTALLKQMEELIEEPGLTCCICREGYKFQVQLLPGAALLAPLSCMSLVLTLARAEVCVCPGHCPLQRQEGMPIRVLVFIDSRQQPLTEFLLCEARAPRSMSVA